MAAESLVGRGGMTKDAAPVEFLSGCRRTCKTRGVQFRSLAHLRNFAMRKKNRKAIRKAWRTLVKVILVGTAPLIFVIPERAATLIFVMLVGAATFSGVYGIK